MRITTEISIDMGHRVTNHGGKCRSLHGHRYRIEATLWSPAMFSSGEQEGMVMDFGFLKALMMEIIDVPCDHGTCLWIKDPQLIHALGPLANSYKSAVQANGFATGMWEWGKLYAVDFVPTAENLAYHWFQRLLLQVDTDIGARKGYLYSVTVWETPNCRAIYKITGKDSDKCPELTRASLRVG
jgi:6-pyruvoyltetrahydropterin/6-carboxytetrahydropterin synthase